MLVRRVPAASDAAPEELASSRVQADRAAPRASGPAQRAVCNVAHQMQRRRSGTSRVQPTFNHVVTEGERLPPERARATLYWVKSNHQPKTTGNITSRSPATRKFLRKARTDAACKARRKVITASSRTAMPGPVMTPQRRRPILTACRLGRETTAVTGDTRNLARDDRRTWNITHPMNENNRSCSGAPLTEPAPSATPPIASSIPPTAVQPAAASRPLSTAQHMRIPRKLDSRSTANWTPVPPQTGHLFQAKLDSRSEATRGGDAVYAVMGSSVNLGSGAAMMFALGRAAPRRRLNIEKLVMIAPQAFSASAVAPAAQCGQRVNEWGQAGDNAGHRPGRRVVARRRCPRLVPTLARRHSRFVHTESAHTGPQARSPTRGCAPAGAFVGPSGLASIARLTVAEGVSLRRDSPARCSGWA